MWSQFLLPKVPIWSPFHSKLSPHWVPILNNFGPHSKWEQGWLLSHVVLVYSVITGSSQKNPDPSGQFRTIIGTLVRIRTKFRIPDLIEPRLGLGGLEWSLWCSTSAQVHCGEVQVQLCFASLNRRFDTGFGTWLENSLQRQNLGLLDKIGTFLGPFWDLSGTFCRYFHENYRKTYTRLKRL